MKKIISAIAFISFISIPTVGLSQDKNERLENLEEKEKVSVNRHSDSVRIIIGEKTISVEQYDDRTQISFAKRDVRNKKEKRFRGHLGGIGFGFNGFLTDLWGASLEPGDEYFDINTAKSMTWNFSLRDVNVKIARNIGFVSTLGLTFNNYRFDNNNSITKDALGVVAPLYPPQGINYRKSAFKSGYLNIPVVLELQLPVNGSHSKRAYISGGVIGSAKLWSKTKVVWNDGGKHKRKAKDDFSMNVLRWGATARVGYGSFQIYGNAYFTPMFEKGKGPELYPFETGIAFTFN